MIYPNFEDAHKQEVEVFGEEFKVNISVKTKTSPKR